MDIDAIIGTLMMLSKKVMIQIDVNRSVSLVKWITNFVDYYHES